MSRRTRPSSMPVCTCPPSPEEVDAALRLKPPERGPLLFGWCVALPLRPGWRKEAEAAWREQRKGRAA